MYYIMAYTHNQQFFLMEICLRQAKKSCRIKAGHHYIWQTLFANACHI